MDTNLDLVKFLHATQYCAFDCFFLNFKMWNLFHTDHTKTNDRPDLAREPSWFMLHRVMLHRGAILVPFYLSCWLRVACIFSYVKQQGMLMLRIFSKSSAEVLPNVTWVLGSTADWHWSFLWPLSDLRPHHLLPRLAHVPKVIYLTVTLPCPLLRIGINLFNSQHMNLWPKC